MRAGWSRIAAVVALTAALGTAACSSSGDSDELLVYSAQHESLTKEWIEAFTAETGIPVTYRQGGDTEMGNQLVAEGDASPADVFLTIKRDRELDSLAESTDGASLELLYDLYEVQGETYPEVADEG